MKVFALLILLFCSVASATTYYVDYASGDDANNGTTTGTPWKHLPMDSRASGVSDATTLVSGDVLAIRRGVTYVNTGQMVYPTGSLGNHVVVDGDLWGTGAKAIFSGNNLAYGLFTDGGATRNYATFRNLIIQDYGGYAETDAIYDGITISSVDIDTDTFTSSADHTLSVGDDIQFNVTSGTLPSPLVGGAGSTTTYYVKTVPTSTTFTISSTNGGATTNVTSVGSGTIKAWEPVTDPPGGVGFDIRGKSDYLTFENIDFLRIGQWRNVPPMSGTNSVTGNGIVGVGNESISIINCTFKKMRTCIAFGSGGTRGPAANILIDGCSISEYVVWGIDIGANADGAVFENIEIKDTAIFDYHEHDQGNWKGFGEKPHTDGIFLRTTGKTSTWTNVRIHGCEFYADNKGSSAGGTAAIYISEGPSVLIYNCIFDAPSHTRMIGIGHWSRDPQVVRIYNNTFINQPANILMATETRPAYRTVHYANNICFATWAASNGILISSETSEVDPILENNLYFHTGFNATQWKPFQVNGWTWATLANVQSMGFEASSVNANPLFLDVSGTFINKNYRLGTGSAAIGMGQNLSAYFTTDKDGNARPAVGAWDVGAYQYDADPPVDTVAPEIISVEIDSTGGSGSIIFNEPVQGVDLSHYSFSTGEVLSGLSGSGANWAFTVSPIVQVGQVLTLSYTEGIDRTRDIPGNLLATVSGIPVENNSLESSPDPPRASGRGSSARRIKR